ncbi:hypothetical protein ACFX5K_01410 [Rickettsiales bacterium LUAb2]
MAQHYIIILEIVFPVITAIFTWYMWSLSQKFTSKNTFNNFTQNIISQEQFKSFKEKIYNSYSKMDEKYKSLENQIYKQNNIIVELNVNMKNITETLKEIKDYLFNHNRNFLNK